MASLTSKAEQQQHFLQAVVSIFKVSNKLSLTLYLGMRLRETVSMQCVQHVLPAVIVPCSFAGTSTFAPAELPVV